jgi:hypothetical protein
MLAGLKAVFWSVTLLVTMGLLGVLGIVGIGVVVAVVSLPPPQATKGNRIPTAVEARRKARRADIALVW